MDDTRHRKDPIMDTNRQLDLIATVSKIEERTFSMQKDVQNLNNTIENLHNDIEKNFVTQSEFAPIRETYVTKDQFEPVRNLVFGFAAILLAALVTAIVGVVIA